MTNRITTQILLLIFNFFYISAGGFKGDTLVATPHGYTPIASLRVGSLVLSYNFECTQIQARRILHAESHFTQNFLYSQF